MRYCLLLCCVIIALTGCKTPEEQDPTLATDFRQQPFNLGEIDDAVLGTAAPSSYNYINEPGNMYEGVDLPIAVGPGATFVEPGSGMLPPEIAAQAQAVIRDIHFPYDSSRIMPNDAEILQGIAGFLQQNPQVLLQIEGHCDERGTEEYNMALGSRRAGAVRQFLADLGVNPNRLYTISYGEERPLNPANNESAWAENRRAHFLVGMVGQ
jgi:peptidoglycan-associated lipoprotein